MTGGSPIDPLDLERISAEERVAAGEATSEQVREAQSQADSYRKAKKKRPHRVSTQAAALSKTGNDLIEAQADLSDYSDTESEGGTDTESDFSDEDAEPKHERVALDPKRIVLKEIDQQGAFTLPAEHVEYIRQQLSTEQPDEMVQRIVLVKTPVPENIQQPPRRIQPCTGCRTTFAIFSVR